MAAAKESTPLVPADAKKPKLLLTPIEGARTLFSMGIILYHISTHATLSERFSSSALSASGPAVEPGPFEKWFHVVTINGSAFSGVTFFFVVSGFLAEVAGHPSPTGVHDRAKVIATRFLRLAPAYYIAIASLACSIAFSTGSAPTLTDAITELLMIHRWTLSGSWGAGEGLFFNGPGWFVSALFGHQVLQTLLGTSLEWLTPGAWSALLGALLFSVLRITLYVHFASNPDEGIVAEGITYEPATNLRLWYYYWTVATYPAFLAGYCTARLVNHLPADGAVRSWRGWVLVDLISYVLFLSLYLVRVPGTEWMNTGGSNPDINRPEGLFYAQFCLPLFCLFCFQCCCTHQGLVLRVLGFPTFVSLGPYSYAAYLIQMFWITIGSDVFEEETSLGFPLFVLISCWGSAAVIHHLIEKPLAPRTKMCLDRAFDSYVPRADGAEAAALKKDAV